MATPGFFGGAGTLWGALRLRQNSFFRGKGFLLRPIKVLGEGGKMLSLTHESTNSIGLVFKALSLSAVSSLKRTKSACDFLFYIIEASKPQPGPVATMCAV